MQTSTVLILGSQRDEHAAHVFAELRRREFDVEYLDSRLFPQTTCLSLEPVSGEWRIDLPSGRTIRASQIRSVYWRNYEECSTPVLPDSRQNYVAANDSRGLFESLLIELPTRWVNGWDAYRLHQTKPVQLARVARLGIETPATLLTNHPREVLRFATQHEGCIFKPVQGGDHARRLTADHLSLKNLESLKFAPVTVQEEIHGTNIRVFVAGERVAACEVRTGSVDYRDDPRCELLPHELPDDVASQCRRLARELHLRWTGIDFRLTPESRYIFLEANPSPMFLGFEAATGLPLTEMLIELLIAG